MSLKKVAAAIKRHKYFLITAHTNLEGDALGAELAFYKLLKALKKEAVVVNDDKIPYGYEFLPEVQKIKKFKGNLKKIKFSCLVVLDCSDLSRCGQISQVDFRGKAILNIDHHISNRKFGQVNWVQARASSASEMVYKIYQQLGVPIDQEVATLLYTGIIADTGSFRYSNTSALTHRIVARLLEHNLDIPGIYRQVYENVPFSDARLLNKILPQIKRDPSGKIIWFELPRRLLKKKKVYIDLSDHLLSFGRAIKDVEVVALFKENLGTDEIRVNLRSQGRVDVNKIANFFGGGGHKTASGITLKGDLTQIRKKVLARIREAL